MIPQIIAIGKDISFTMKNGKTISGRVLNADCAGTWCRILVKDGCWKLIKGVDVQAAAVV